MESAPSTTYQIYLSGTWFGRIQEEYIEILDESLNNVPIHFDQNKYENYKNYAWHNNDDTLTGQSNQIHIKTLPRITGAYYWIMDSNNNSPFTVILEHGKNYKIRGYTKYDDSDIKYESSKYDITFALKDLSLIHI